MTTLAAVRRILAAVLLFAMTGTFLELLLLGHDEDAVQFVPLVLLAIGAVVVAWRAFSGSPASALATRLVMILFLAGGAAGVYYHYAANVGFQREGDPSLTGRALFMAALTAKAPPALAPGVMVQLGLIGLAYTYRYKEN